MVLPIDGAKTRLKIFFPAAHAPCMLLCHVSKLCLLLHHMGCCAAQMWALVLPMHMARPA